MRCTEQAGATLGWVSEDLGPPVGELLSLGISVTTAIYPSCPFTPPTEPIYPSVNRRCISFMQPAGFSTVSISAIVFPIQLGANCILCINYHILNRRLL